jgi:hypothetical protein
MDARAYRREWTFAKWFYSTAITVLVGVWAYEFWLWLT